MNEFDADSARAFCERWLPAWSGTDSAQLASFYAHDAFYSDPARPEGLRGREALQSYFQALLARYGDWVWTHERSLPVPDGFLNFWNLSWPERPDTPATTGVCVVQLREGLIYRNEVFFDTRHLPR